MREVPEIAASYACKTLTELASQYCGIHPMAASYLEAAPVLLTTATHFPKALSRGNVAITLSRCERGARARTILAAERLAWPLRKLEPASIPANSPALLKKTLLFMSVYVDNSTLAQSIPTCATEQRAWINSLGGFLSRIDRRMVNQAFSIRRAITWASLAFSRAERKPSDDIADFIIAAPNEFNYAWTYEQAERAAERWHETLGPDAKRAEAFQKKYGVSLDDEVPLGAYPRKAVMDEYSFEALLTGRTLLVEGQAMRHCVGSYFPDVRAGVARIYSIKRDGVRVATLELNPSGEIKQLKGTCNAAVGAPTKSAASRFAKSIRDEIAKALAT